MSKEQKLNYLAIAELEAQGIFEPTQCQIDNKEAELMSELGIGMN